MLPSSLPIVAIIPLVSITPKVFIKNVFGKELKFKEKFVTFELYIAPYKFVSCHFTYKLYAPA
jgi:hypothetical protein